MRPMKLVLVEDNYAQAESIQAALRGSFPGVAVDVISTESEFHHRISSYCSSPPDGVVLDMMFRWCNANEMIAAPTDVLNATSTAGVRCINLLRHLGLTSPVVVYTVLDWSDVREELAAEGDQVRFVPKQGSFSELVAALKELIGK